MSQYKSHRLDLEKTTRLLIGGTYLKTLPTKSPRQVSQALELRTEKLYQEEETRNVEPWAGD